MAYFHGWCSLKSIYHIVCMKIRSIDSMRIDARMLPSYCMKIPEIIVSSISFSLTATCYESIESYYHGGSVERMSGSILDAQMLDKSLGSTYGKQENKDFAVLQSAAMHYVPSLSLLSLFTYVPFFLLIYSKPCFVTLREADLIHQLVSLIAVISSKFTYN